METPHRPPLPAGPGSAAPASGRPGAVARALDGAAFLPRGIREFLATPGVRLLGIAPVLLAAVLVGAALTAVALWVDELARLVTPFADDWSQTARTGLRVLTGLALLGATLALIVVTFAALVNLIGQPFYERIADRVETRLGGHPPADDTPWWRSWPRATLESLALLAVVLLTSLPLLVLGVVPVVGQTVAPVLGAMVSGFFLAIELLAIPLERRGLRLRQRLRFAWANRATVIGFGVAAFLLFLVPLMNIVAMPGAIVGGVLLARHLHAGPGSGRVSPAGGRAAGW
jgi:CysZ protein